MYNSQTGNRAIRRFPEMGVPPVIIHFSGVFPHKASISRFQGTPIDDGNPHIEWWFQWGRSEVNLCFLHQPLLSPELPTKASGGLLPDAVGFVGKVGTVAVTAWRWSPVSAVSAVSVSMATRDNPQKGPRKSGGKWLTDSPINFGYSIYKSKWCMKLFHLRDSGNFDNAVMPHCTAMCFFCEKR